MEPMLQPLNADGGGKPGQDVGPKGDKAVPEEGLEGKGLPDALEPARIDSESGSDPVPDDKSKGDKGL